MDRITARNEQGFAYLVNVKPDEQEVESPYKNTLRCILDCFEQCAQYEDTGLTPEEVAHAKDLLAAEKDGRCVVLPCKVGDIVYLTIHGYVEETKVRTFFVGHPSHSYVPFDPRYYMVRLEKYDIPLWDVGKTVFLTRAEAEKALEAQS